MPAKIGNKRDRRNISTIKTEELLDKSGYRNREKNKILKELGKRGIHVDKWLKEL